MSWAIPQKITFDRERVAQLATVMIAALLMLASQAVVMQHDALRLDEPISLTIISPPTPPEQIALPPPPTLQPPQPQQVQDRPKLAMPVAEAPAQVAQPVADAPITPVEKSEPIKAQPVQPQSNGVAEGLFAQDVRTRIERKKIYPDTARDLGMTGEVEVLYELDRNGNLLRAEITTSSGYKLLDQAALKAVKSATYKSFPDDAWLGMANKVFRTKLVFSINQ
jgi:periplasmic protein TonB